MFILLIITLQMGQMKTIDMPSQQACEEAKKEVEKVMSNNSARVVCIREVGENG